MNDSGVAGKTFDKECRQCQFDFFREKMRFVCCASLAVLICALSSGCQTFLEKRVARISLDPYKTDTLKSNPHSNAIAVKLSIIDKRDITAPGISRKWGKSQVGYSKNGFGEQIDPVIVVNETIEAMFASAFTSALTAAGFRVSDRACQRLDVEIDNFFNDYAVQNIGVAVWKNSVADLGLHVTLKSLGGETRFAKNFAMQKEVEARLTLTEIESARLALSQVFSEGIRRVMADQELSSVMQIGSECKPFPD